MDTVKISMTPEYFGRLWEYVNDKSITDIDFNGKMLWIRNADNYRYLVSDHGISERFVEQFTQRVADTASKGFNRIEDILEAETDTLRISIIHNETAVTGTSISIRKSLPEVRITAVDAVKSGYADKRVLSLIANCVKAKMNIAFGGEVGVGKTEAAKFFTQVIPANERVITIEDRLEWHYSEINPGKDCVALKARSLEDYPRLIKEALTHNANWIMLSEARSVEVKYLIQAWSTGIRGVTTLHIDDVRNIPDRVVNMSGDALHEKRIENDVYTYLDVGVYLRQAVSGDEDKNGHRWIDQIGFFTRENGVNNCTLTLDEKKRTEAGIPEHAMKKFERVGIKDPFYCPEIEKMLDSQNASTGDTVLCAESGSCSAKKGE